MVFDQGVVTLSGENLRPGPGSADRVEPRVTRESLRGSQAWPPRTRAGTLVPKPFLHSENLAE